MNTYVVQEERAITFRRYAVRDVSTRVIIDRFRSQTCAESAARALNAGAARINPHAVIGCRVEVVRIAA